MQSTTLQRLIDEYVENNGQDGLAEHITSVLYKEKDIKCETHRLRQTIVEEQRKFDEKKSQIQSQITQLQINCPHWEFSFHGDPAGGSDSYHECWICKKQW